MTDTEDEQYVQDLISRYQDCAYAVVNNEATMRWIESKLKERHIEIYMDKEHVVHSARPMKRNFTE